MNRNKVEEEQFTVKEIEFFAGDTPIMIIPLFNGDKLDFISNEYGPFRVNVPTEVPLWLGMKLKKQQKCRIIAPNWFSEKLLVEKLQSEREKTSEFAEIHWHYIEITKILFQNAQDDIENAEKVRSLIKSIEETREEKIRLGLKAVDHSTTFIAVNNISCMELNRIRFYASKILDEFKKFQDAIKSF
ncbi:hypothetical protein MHBO_001467 [Bonamia ostreae]|uniref:DNA replication complex GINS protein PSF2 n=1 Tax=Bonamia ostreae TaxID=126728 RepID=A0ABV2AJ46_9EUKA